MRAPRTPAFLAQISLPPASLALRPPLRLPPHPIGAPPSSTLPGASGGAGRGVTLYQPLQLSVSVVAPDQPLQLSVSVVAPDRVAKRSRSARADPAPSGSVVPCTMPPPPSPSFTPSRSKGHKHASKCAGPFVGVLASMPPPPVTGSKRAKRGLADVPAPREAERAIEAERAARALVAILPSSAAPFILEDPPEAVSARPVEEVGEALVKRLTPFGKGSLEGATSFLGNLLAWVVDHRPGASSIIGSHVADYFEACPPSGRALDSQAWLRDWCGLDLPARGSTVRPYRGRAATRSYTKMPFDLHIVEGLRVVATTHPSLFVRAHAAGWYFLAKAALRYEQSLCFVFNAFVRHLFRGEYFTVASGVTIWEKDPRPSMRKPRPVWAVIDDDVHQELRAALTGAEAVKCLLLDTDSPSGSPSEATRWVLSPLSSPSRMDASLHHILRLSPISLGDAASLYKPHGAKRFMPSLAEDSPLFTSTSGHEFGNFSVATSRQRDLAPTQAMLAAHTLRCQRLPAIYAASARVSRVFDRLSLAELAIREALGKRTCGSWGDAGPFAASELEPLPPEVPPASA